MIQLFPWRVTHVCSFLSDAQYKADLNAKAYQYFLNMEEQRKRVEEERKRQEELELKKKRLSLKFAVYFIWFISNNIYVNLFYFQEDQTECEVESSGDEQVAKSGCGAKRRFGAASRVQVDNGVIKVLQKKSREKKADSTIQKEKNGLC